MRREAELGIMCGFVLALAACASHRSSTKDDGGRPPLRSDAGPLDGGRTDASAADAAAHDASTALDAAAPTECPPGSVRQGRGFGDGSCPRRATCFEHGELTCASYYFTQGECEEAGGTALLATGGGDVIEDGCPVNESAVGVLSPPLEGLCCKDIRACAPQQLYPGDCDDDAGFEVSWRWDGFGCYLLPWCSGLEQGGTAPFATEQDCQAAYEGCTETARGCGVGHGGRCARDEYCAYVWPDDCGGGDQSAVCQRRPQSCDEVDEPVCGCNYETYANACEAARAGFGVRDLGACD